MGFKIKEQSFYISSNNVQPTLDELTSIYPTIKQSLDYDEPASNLQYVLFILGYHCRINIDGSIFTISCLKGDGTKIEQEDSIATLTCLSHYMTDDSYIAVEHDGREVRFEKNNVIIQEVESDITIEEIIEAPSTSPTDEKEEIKTNNNIKKKGGRPKRSLT